MRARSSRTIRPHTLRPRMTAPVSIDPTLSGDLVTVIRSRFRIGPEQLDHTASALLRALEENEDRSIIIASAAGPFIFGPEYPTEGPSRKLLGELFERIGQHRLPTVAAVGGSALGLDLEMALSTDLRVVVPGVRFGYPQALHETVAIAPLATRLTRLGGPQLAARMLYLGEQPVAGNDPIMEHICRVYDGELQDAISDWAEALDKGAPLALEGLTTALRAAATLPADAALAIEADLASLLLPTEDRAEGIAAFLAGRPPNFGGS